MNCKRKSKGRVSDGNSVVINFFLGGEEHPLADWLSALPPWPFRFLAPPQLALELVRVVLSIRSFKFHSQQLSIMVLQDLGRRINSAVNDLTRSNNLDEKVGVSPIWHKTYMLTRLGVR